MRCQVMCDTFLMHLSICSVTVLSVSIHFHHCFMCVLFFPSPNILCHQVSKCLSEKCHYLLYFSIPSNFISKKEKKNYQES